MRYILAILFFAISAGSFYVAHELRHKEERRYEVPDPGEITVEPTVIDPFMSEDRGTKRQLKKDIAKRFEHAPDITYSIALKIAKGDARAHKSVKALDEDLLADVFLTDKVTLPGGREIATHSSLLSEAVRSRNHAVTQTILQRLGADYPEAQRIALGFAMSPNDPSGLGHRGEIYLSVFAKAGGSLFETRLPNNGETLGELLAANSPKILLHFIAEGFDPWQSLDPADRDAGGLSLGEILALNPSPQALSALEFLLVESNTTPPALRVAANIHSNLEYQVGKENIPAGIAETLQMHITQSQK